jgi:hypothetical protein
VVGGSDAGSVACALKHCSGTCRYQIHIWNMTAVHTNDCSSTCSLICSMSSAYLIGVRVIAGHIECQRRAVWKTSCAPEEAQGKC